MNNQILFTQELITPKIAKAYLSMSKGNRRLNEDMVSSYTKDMLNDMWRGDTAEPIKITDTGILIDGHHRLNAVIKSNKSQYFTVAKGLPSESMAVLDTGKTRTSTDLFNINKIPHGNTIPSMIVQYNLISNGIVKSSGRRNSRLNNREVLEVYYKEPEFWKTVVNRSEIWYKSFAKILPPSLIGGMYALLYKKHGEIAISFFEQLTTGKDITNNSIHLLRNRLIADKVSVNKVTPAIKKALIIKSWNAFYQDVNLKTLRYSPEKESFPEIL